MVKRWDVNRRSLVQILLLVNSSLFNAKSDEGSVTILTEFAIDTLKARGACTGVNQTEITILNAFSAIVTWVHVAWVLGC